MRKSFCHLLGASLAFSLALPVAAAPLAKGYGAIGSKVAVKAVANEKEAPMTFGNELPAASLPGLRVAASPVALKRQKAARSAQAAARALSSTTNLIGQSWTSSTLSQNHYYLMPHATGEEFVDLGYSSYNLNFGHYYDAETNTITGVASQILWNEPTFIYLMTYDATTFEQIEKRDIDDVNMMAVSGSADRDPATGLMYGFFYNGSLSEFVWGYADYSEATRTAIKTVSASDLCYAVTFDKEGNLFGVKAFDGSLVKIEKETGEMSTLAETAIPTTSNIGSTYNARNNSLLINAVDASANKSSLIEVDLSTYETSTLATYPMVQLYNMFIRKAEAADKAPDAPQLTVSAPEGAMTAEFAITLPTTLFDGTPLTSAVDWTLSVNGVVKMEGRNQAGTTVTDHIVIDEPGMTEFAAVCSNAEGNSPAEKVSIFVGKGAPAAPATATATWEDGMMTISWDAVTTSSDGGYINPDEVVYDIVVDNNLIARGINATAFGLAVDMPAVHTDYQYGVVARYNGKTSTPTLTNKVGLGDYAAPFSTKFNSTAIFNEFGYMVVDANADGSTWTAETSGARYKYSSKNTGDDWLFTPNITLEAGKAYVMDFTVASENATYTETVEVKAGQGATPDAMAAEVVPATVVTAVLRTGPMTLTGIFIPEVSGVYNIGVHAVSQPDRYYLWLTELQVGAPLDAAAPAAPAAFALTPDATGLLTVKGEVTLPSKSLAGQDLTGTVSALITCGDRTVATVSGAPGAVVTFTDKVEALGTYEYTATAMVGDAKGLAINAAAFVGPYAPVAPTAPYIFETYQPGTVTLTWTAPTVDINGNPVAADQLTYQVFGIDAEGNLVAQLAQPTAATTATFKALPDGVKQDFVQYAVFAYNRGVVSEDACVTSLIPVGTPYDMPVEISNVDDIDNVIVGVDAAGGAVWRMAYAENLAVPECDADGIVFYSYSQYYGRYADLFTGKINITEAERPELSFYTWKHADDDEDIIQVYVMHDGTETLLESVCHADMETGQWNKVRLDLTPYIGKNIQVRFRSVCCSYSYILMDNIQIREVPACDLAALYLLTPTNVKAGEEFTIRAMVENYGYEAAKGATIALYRDGVEIDSQDLASLEPDDLVEVLFTDKIDHFDTKNHEAEYHAVLSLDGDADLRNNQTPKVLVNRPLSTLQGVDDLAAELTEEGVKLTWTPYSLDDVEAVEITEDFESGEPFADSFGDWTFIDKDGSEIDPPFSCPQIYGHVGAFWVFDTSANDAYSTNKFTPVSGSKYLAAFLNYDWSANDDWAISPRLCGDAQTISFYARGWNSLYSESFEVYYTDGDPTDFDNYDLIDAVDDLGNEWTRYEFELPEGAKHFAIRYMSDWVYLMMIDDVTFTPDPMSNALTLKGYHIYRDGQLITDVPVNAGEFVDTDADTSVGHTYHVVAHYEQGASELSNPATVEVAGLGAVAAASAKVAVEGRAIVVAGAETLPVSIATIDGKLLYSATGDTRLTVAPAIYLVTVGNRTVKLLVP